MRKLQEVLRLHFACHCSSREIAASCGTSPSTVSDYIARANAAGLTWELIQPLAEAELETRLFRFPKRAVNIERAPIDFGWMHQELRHAGVTLQLLWSEYQLAAEQAGRTSYQYSQFCERYRAWRGQRRLSMRQTHRAGEKVFIDYSGVRPKIVDPKTGEVKLVELFVAVLGASDYTYAEVTLTQRLPDFVGSFVRTLEFFGAAPEIGVPDQLRSAVAKPDRYDAEVNQLFFDCARHYGMAIIPAPPRTPKGKAKVENGVLIAQRWILARLRHRTFFSLEDLQRAVAELVEELNNRQFTKLPGTRREAFLAIDLPSMKPLPAGRFELKERKTARVNIDYHVVFDERHYSVPHQLTQKVVDVYASETLVEIFHRGMRVASHRRSYEHPRFPITSPEHRPKSHEDYGSWPPERMLVWAARFGDQVEELVRRTMGRLARPEMSYRAVLGILRCAEKAGAERMNAACHRALAAAGAHGVPHRRMIEEILKRGLENQPLTAPPMTRTHDHHENVRGADYYDKENNNDHRRDRQQADTDETPRPGKVLPGDVGNPR
jgi:transposase